MAAKLGAEPWAVPIPLKDTMVIGYDSYHDSSTKGMAVGAVVSTINGVSLKNPLNSVSLNPIFLLNF